MGKLGESVVYIKANRKHLVAGLKTAYKGVVTTTALMQTQLNKLNLKAFGNKLTTVTKKMVKWGSVIGVAMAGFTLKKSIGEFAKFETALVDMRKVTTEGMDSIKAKMFELPVALGTVTEKTKGYYQIISAGITDTTKSMDMLTTSMKAGKASHVATAEVVKGLTKTMAGYEGEIKNATEASDMLYAIERGGQTTYAELIPHIGGMAKFAKDLGIKNQELGASFATVTMTAGNTSEAATRVERLMVALMKPTETMTALLKGYGYESAQAAIKELGFIGTLKMMKDSTKGSASALAELFSRKEALMALSAMAARNFETFNEKLKIMYEAAGMTDKAFERWKGTLAGLWTETKNLLINIIVLMGEGLAPKIKDILETTNKWAKANKNLINQEVRGYVDKLITGLEKLYKHRDTIITVFKVGVLTVAITQIAVLTTNVIALATALKGLAAIKIVGALTVGGVVAPLAAGIAATYAATQAAKAGKAPPSIPMPGYQYKPKPKAETWEDRFRESLQRIPKAEFTPPPISPKGRPGYIRPLVAEQWYKAPEEEKKEEEKKREFSARAFMTLRDKETEYLIKGEIRRTEQSTKLAEERATEISKITKRMEDFKVETIMNSTQRAMATENLRFNRQKEQLVENFGDNKKTMEMIELATQEHEMRMSKISDDAREIDRVKAMQAAEFKVNMLTFYANRFSDVMANSVMQAGNAFDNIKKGFADMLKYMAAQMAAKAAMFSILSVIFPGFGTAWAAKGGIGAFLGLKAPAYQMGGFVGRPGTVEAGEYVMPRQATSLLGTEFLDAIKKMAQGGNITNDYSRSSYDFGGQNRGAMMGLTDRDFADRIKRLKREGYQM